MISELTPEQESQISVIREKWRQIALSTQRVNRHKAVDAILAAYTIAGVKPSKIVFCDSPYTAFMYTSQEKPSWGEPTDLLGDELQARLERQLGTQLDIQLSSQLTEELKIELCRMDKPEDQQLLCNLPHMAWNLWMILGQQLGREWWGFDAPSLIDPMQWASQWSWIDYCISVLGCSCDQTRWQAFQTLTQECGWVLPYEKVCLVCDRPTYISFDGNCPVYETGEAVMQYVDGFTITGTVEGGPTPEDLQFTFPEAANWSEFILSAPEGDDRFLSHLILELTKEQEALIPVARQKWKGMIFQTNEIDRQQVTETVQAAYAAIGSTAPEIVFCSSPHAALVEHQVGNQGEEQVGEELNGRFDRILWSDLENELESQLGFKLEKHLTRELNQDLKQMYFNSGESKLSIRLGSKYDIIDLGWFVQPAWWACAGAYIDFCVSVLNCAHNPEKWRVFQALVQHCGWIFPYTKVCYVCERPVSLFVPVDEDDCLTNLNEPLIQFADGFNLFLQPEQDYSDFEQDDLQE